MTCFYDLYPTLVDVFSMKEAGHLSLTPPFGKNTFLSKLELGIRIKGDLTTALACRKPCFGKARTNYWDTDYLNSSIRITGATKHYGTLNLIRYCATVSAVMTHPFICHIIQHF